MTIKMYLKEKFEIITNKYTDKRLFFLLAYSVCYLFVAGSIFSIFLMNGKSFIWVPDGLQQHFNALLYYRSWLQEIIRTLFIEHRLEIPLWDIHIGMGSDVLTTLHYYVIGDPLNLLSVFVPAEKYMETFYNAMILLRIYLAGLAFAGYCRFHKQSVYATLLGSMVYAFCYWSIVAIRHPYFLNPMIYLPLIFIGVDKIYEKKKPWLYIGMLSLATVSSFYFSYMICIFILIYVFLRYFMQYHKLVIKKDVWGWIGKFMLYSITALLIASVILVPVVMMTLSTGRANTSAYLPLFYSSGYYLKLFTGFLIGGSSHWSELGYTGLEILTIIILFVNRKRFKGIKLGYIFMTLLLLLPFAGHLLNGGSYAVNRFMWAYSLLVAFIGVKMYPLLVTVKRREKLILAAAGAIYIAICLVIYCLTKNGRLLLALLLFFAMLSLITCTTKEQKQTLQFRAIFLVLVLSQLIYQGYAKYAPAEGDYVSEFADSGKALSMLTTDTAGTLVANLQPDAAYRYESSHDAELKNTSMQLGMNGVSYYFSLANPYINQFQREMCINQTRDFCYSGFDGRTILDKLAGVKYYVVKEDERAYVPYLYNTQIGEETLTDSAMGETFLAFENSNALTLGFTSDKYITRSQYEGMNVTQKQQALLQGIVVDEQELSSLGPAADSLMSAALIFNDHSLSYTVKKEKGLTFSDGKIEVNKANATLTLAFDGITNSETYLVFHGLDYANMQSGKNRVHIKAKCGDVSKQITYLNRQNNFYSGVNDFLLNLGYRANPDNTITIKFKEKGIYTFDSLDVVCQPVTNFQIQTSYLRQNELENITFSTNQINGTIALDKTKLLCMSIPYSTGWTAFIDGKKAEILQADTMYMAILVPSGSHEIQFQYETPYVKLGLILTILGLCLLLGLILYERK